MAERPTLERLIARVGEAAPDPVYLVSGDLVTAEPAALRLAEAIAGRAGAKVELRRRPESLAPILADLRTYSLFGAPKVVVAVATGALADRQAAAELIDEAAEALPLGGPEALTGAAREAATRLLQVLRLFELDPSSGEPERLLGELPAWVFQGGASFRRGRAGRGRGRKQAEELRRGCAELLAAAREAGLEGWMAGEIGELAAAVERGLPEGHCLVLAERLVAQDHPVARLLAERGVAVEAGHVERDRRGRWHGLDALARELAAESGVEAEPAALAELARRTLRQGERGGGGGRAEADSTSRFAAEYRKLALIAGGGPIRTELVTETVEDRGRDEVWPVLDAIGDGRPGAALEALRAWLAGAEDPIAARLSFFALFASFCRQLAACAALLETRRLPRAERSYPRFKDRIAAALQEELPGGLPSPLAGVHPFRLHRVYLAASRAPAERVRDLPARLLEAELRLKGASRDPETVLTALVAEVAAAAAPRR